MASIVLGVLLKRGNFRHKYLFRCMGIIYYPRRTGAYDIGPFLRGSLNGIILIMWAGPAQFGSHA